MVISEFFLLLSTSWSFLSFGIFRAHFTFLDSILIIKWNFTIDLSDLDNINRKVVDVSAEIGEVDEQHILSLVSECPKGIDFLKGFVDKVLKYVELLKKRKRLTHQKVV